MPGWRLVFVASLPLVIGAIFSCTGDDLNPSGVVADAGELDREAASPADDAPSDLPDGAVDAGPPKEPPFVVLATNAAPGSLHDDPAGNIYFVTETVGASSIGDASIDEGAVVSLDPKGNVRWTYKGGQLSAPTSCGDDFGNTYVAVAITSTDVAGVSAPDGGSSTASRYALFKVTPSGALGWPAARQSTSSTERRPAPAT